MSTDQAVTLIAPQEEAWTLPTGAGYIQSGLGLNTVHCSGQLYWHVAGWSFTSIKLLQAGLLLPGGSSSCETQLAAVISTSISDTWGVDVTLKATC